MYLIINTIKTQSIIILFQEKNVIDLFIWESDNNQSKELLVYVNKIINKNNKSLRDLMGVVVITGPGSYTGIRVGVATANALAFSLRIKIMGVDMLKLLAAYFFNINPDINDVTTCIHAIYDKYYYAKYSRDKNNNIIEQKTGNEKIAKVIIKNQTKHIILYEKNDKFIKDCQIKLANSEFQKFIAQYTYKVLKKISKRDHVYPFYLNQPNITVSKHHYH